MTKPPCYYPIAVAFAMPIYRQLVKMKSYHLPTLTQELNERFGKCYPPIPKNSHFDKLSVDKSVDKSDIFGNKIQPDKGIIWCHAVSLGELNTAYPLLNNLLNQGFKLWVTSTTQTGFDRAKELFSDKLGISVQHSFVPVDNLKVVQRFIHHVRPTMAIFIETELWANMLYELNRQGIAAVMVNARLTYKSYESYAKFGQLSKSMMDNLTTIIAQENASANRFIQLGASCDKVVVIDSLKWSSFGQFGDKHRRLLDEINTWRLTHQTGVRRNIWIAASTHEGEEHIVLQAHQILMQQDPSALLVLVPRHPKRFDEVASLCRQMGFDTNRRSQGDRIEPNTQVYLADSMGELLAWYGVVDVAFVAGSLVDKGGHNPIEPAMLAKPIVMGEYTKNCDTLVQELSKAKALIQIKNTPEAMACAVGGWLFDKTNAKIAGQAGASLVTDKQSAADKQTQQLLKIIQGV